MKTLGWKAAVWIGIGMSVLLSACGGGGSSAPPPPVTYVLTVNSTNPSSGVTITVSPSDVNGQGNGTTSFTRTYDSGIAVTLTAPATASGNPFSSWTGCTTASTETCNVTMSSDTSVTANYTAPTITSVTVTPNPATVTIGTTMQFSATVSGTGNYSTAVTWAVSGPSPPTWTGSVGSISSSGLYDTPYPAPATVTVTAWSNQDTSKSGSATVTLQPPPTATGPTLTVDVGTQTYAISPYIYGMNAYGYVQSVDGPANVTVLRWGGDNTSRYNYQNGNTNSAADWYFENQSSVYGMPPSQEFDPFVSFAQSIGAKVVGTVPVLGWVANSTATACSFPVSTYPSQQYVDTTRGCGNGVYLDGSDITGNDPAVTSITADSTWAGSWVAYLVGQFKTAADGGVLIYDLDNEPPWWDAEHRDVHPSPFTYDEVTNNGIATALAIKTADPTAEVSGPVMDWWWDYFYSKLDVESGWSTGPCYAPWSNPVDREAPPHNGVPFIEYYLQQFAAYDKAHSLRLLDYLDLHTYFAAYYNGSPVAFTTAGDTGEQEARVNSTRVFWDPSYTDPNYPQPNYGNPDDCSPPLQAPQLIPMMQEWVGADYPDTMTAITEYNWGGQEHINGAVAQADILGIFGEYGLDLATLWGAPDASQLPGLIAFEIYRNYDGKNSTFGDTALQSTSADQSQLSVYGALRTLDQAVTVVVINKTYGDLTTTLYLANFTSSSATAEDFLYSNTDLTKIVPQTPVTVTAPSTGGAPSTINNITFPAQSITLLVVPQ